ncbi:MAG: hypothetical protein U9O94_05915 [Nanoarchaeota archaeon]|nr:hypothetical protein [Nanoarchaeota archaeon]
MSDLQEIEISIEKAKELIKKKEVCERLLANKDYKEIIKEGFFEKNAARLVRLRSDITLDEQERAAVLRDIDGTGTLIGYIHMILAMGESAENSLSEKEAVREEIAAEELN